MAGRNEVQRSNCGQGNYGGKTQPGRQPERRLHTEGPRKKKREREKKKREHQMDLLEKQNQRPPTPTTPISPKTHKWEHLCPTYSEEDNDIAEYLTTFERLCVIHEIPDDKRSYSDCEIN